MQAACGIQFSLQMRPAELVTALKGTPNIVYAKKPDQAAILFSPNRTAFSLSLMHIFVFKRPHAESVFSFVICACLCNADAISRSSTEARVST